MPLPRSYIAIVLAVAVASAGVPRPFAATAGDTNGDSTVDVLDVQRVVAAVLRDGGTPDDDVNGDGRVDVLDFQCIVQAANTQDAPSPALPQPTRGDTAPRPPRVEGMATARAPAAILLTDDSDARWRCAGASECDVKSGPKEGRYLLGLTPHAPPAFV